MVLPTPPPSTSSSSVSYCSSEASGSLQRGYTPVRTSDYYAIPMPQQKGYHEDAAESSSRAQPSAPPRENSYSLERYLQDPVDIVPDPRDPDTRPYAREYPRRHTRMQSPTPTGAMQPARLGAPPRPRLLLMGLRRSGKSSISSVVFHKMPPSDTLFLESTTRIQKDPVHSFMEFMVWDVPGQLDFLFDATFDLEAMFNDVGALIWVIDAQDEILDPLNRLHATIILLQRQYPNVNVEVFIHKVDGLSDEYKLDTQRDIMQRTQDELSDAGFENVQISYHLTSIYDHSIFEAFSKVIQKLIPQLGTLENLLNVLCSNSGIDKAFLFDVLSKIYVATDSSPVDVQSYEICSDYIDVIVDVSEIYGYDRTPKKEKETTEGPSSPPVSPGHGSHKEGSSKREDIPEVSSVIRLQNGMVLYLREINKFLALICLMRKESIERQGLVDFNVNIFQDALTKVLEAGSGTSRRGSAHGGMEYR